MSDFELWLGDEKSYREQQEHKNRVRAGEFLYEPPEAGPDPVAEEGVLVIPVTGSLAREDDPWGDSTSYTRLADILYAAREDDNTEYAILDVDSPGGSPYGLSDVIAAIRDFKAEKPVYTYVAGQMSSAAMWLGSAADRIFVPPVASVGSIGVVAVHHEVTKALEDEGVAVTVLRTGEFKAVGNPYETLDDTARGEIEREMLVLHRKFVEAIANHRGVPVETAAAWANGRSWGADEALRMGLVDQIGTFNDVLRYAAENLKQPRGHAMSITSRVAAATSAAPVQASPVAGEQAEPVAEDPAAPTTPPAAPEIPAAAASASAVPDEIVVSPAADVEPEAEDNTEEEAPETPSPAAAAESSPSAIGELTALLAAAQADAARKGAELEALQAKYNTLAGQTSTLVDATAARVRFMQTALGQTPTPMAGMSIAALIEMHASVHAQYSKLPIGAVAQTAIDLPSPATGKVVAFAKTAAGRAVLGQG